jgi:sugar transferase (PEP-CTERM/EpsH1 system associated)
MKPALVFLCQRLPYPPITGERITTFNLVRHLTSEYRVFVGTFIDDPDDAKDIQHVRELVEELHVARISKPWAFLRALPRWLAGEPLSFALFRSRELNRWLDHIDAVHTPVAIVTHSSNISAYAVDKFRRSGAAEPKRLLHFADVDSEKFAAYAAQSRGLRKLMFAIEARRVRREERRLTMKSDAVAFVSDEEAELFRSKLDRHQDRIITLPNGVDTELFDPDRYPESPFEKTGPTFVFTGAMDYAPNIDAVTWFAREVFPGLQQALPKAEFLIVGSKPSGTVRELTANPAVRVTGRVPSAAAYLAHADVAVAPLRIARGVQNKVLEAMSMSRPAVVSEGALTGITARPDIHVVCADTREQWIDACVALIRDPARARGIGRNARQLVVEAYSWQAQFARLDSALAGMTGSASPRIDDREARRHATVTAVGKPQRLRSSF